MADSPATKSLTVKPAVLANDYPRWDRAGNKVQIVRLLFICGHEETSYRLDLGKGWKPRTRAQLMNDELRISCPEAWKLCRACSQPAAA